jgi:hydrogenase maturation protease
MNYFEEYPTVILVDATLDGRPAGTIRLIQPRFSKDFPRALSTHDIGLRDVVEGLQVLGKLPRLYLFAVSVEKLQPMADALSPELAAALPALRQQVLALLADLEAA